jgi:segregation and condensation protein B
MSDENPNDQPDETPADEVPADEMPAGEAPADEAPADEAPADEAPADEAPADEMPVEAAPGDDAGAEARQSVEEPVAEEPQPRMELSQLKAVIEALVFASPDPLTPRMLYRLLNDEPKEDVLAALKALQADYVERGGLHMAEVAGGFQITTRPEYHDWVRRLFHDRSSNKLSAASLESLSVIAYKQPVTAAEIGEIRSVNTSGVLSTLLERHLIKIVGRKNVIGRPFLYGTTKEFLIRFGLNDLNDLPKIEDMAQQLGFDPPPVLMERAVPEEMLPLEEGDVPDDQPE